MNSREQQASDIELIYYYEMTVHLAEIDNNVYNEDNIDKFFDQIAGGDIEH